MIWNSKHGQEADVYCFDFNKLGVVEELTVSAFQRHQARQKRSSITPVRGHVLNSKSFVGVIIRRCEWTVDKSWFRGHVLILASSEKINSSFTGMVFHRSDGTYDFSAAR